MPLVPGGPRFLFAAKGLVLRAMVVLPITDRPFSSQRAVLGETSARRVRRIAYEGCRTFSVLWIAANATGTMVDRPNGAWTFRPPQQTAGQMAARRRQRRS
jgi:hypothetical protein